VVGSNNHGNEDSNSVKGEEFIELLSYYQLLKKDCSKKLVC
jgi:hypothetical protein